MSAAFLLADDSPQKILLMRHFLKKANWDGPILTAETTEDAIRLIDEHTEIGCAFVDYYMPSKNGPAVIQYLRNMNPQAKIALVSSSDKKANEEEALCAGADTCICTGYQSDHVERTMLEVLAGWQQE